MPKEVTCECGKCAKRWYDGEHVSFYRCEGGHDALRYASTGRVQMGPTYIHGKERVK